MYGYNIWHGYQSYTGMDGAGTYAPSEKLTCIFRVEQVVGKNEFSIKNFLVWLGI